MFSRIIFAFATKRSRDLLSHLYTMLPSQGKLLDYGCGIGYFGYEVEKQTNCQLTYLDVKTYPFMHPEIELQSYNGERIPYDDLTFDHSMAVFTLHHTKDAYKSLNELVRVTRKYILVSEDFISSPVYKYIEVIKDLVSNCFFSNITMQYRQDYEWEQMFSDFGLSIVKKKHFSTYFIPFKIKHVAWLLEKTPLEKYYSL